MERQIFGFTPLNPETGQPGYIAAHLVEAPEGMFVRLTTADEHIAADDGRVWCIPCARDLAIPMEGAGA